MCHMPCFSHLCHTPCYSHLCHTPCLSFVSLSPCSSRSGRRKEGAESKEDSSARAISVELLGSILASVARSRRDERESPLTFPEEKEEFDVDAQPCDPGEHSLCICGLGFKGPGDWMIDCDKCHR